MVLLPNRPNNLLGLDARFSTLFGCPWPGLAAGESALESPSGVLDGSLGEEQDALC